MTRLMDTQYGISYRLYWIGYKRNVLNYQSSTSLQSPVAMFAVVCNYSWAEHCARLCGTLLNGPTMELCKIQDKELFQIQDLLFPQQETPIMFNLSGLSVASPNEAGAECTHFVTQSPLLQEVGAVIGGLCRSTF